MARAGTRDPRKALERFLRSIAWPDGQAARKGLAYDGPAAFVLEHGEWFAPARPPATIPHGPPGLCFGNAIHAAVLYDLEYVEGWAVTPGDVGLPVHHAWNTDAAGRLVDVTWTGPRASTRISGDRAYRVFGRPGAAYLGVRFSVERADDCTWNGDATVLDDFARGWPLLRERWHGEPARAWPASERLDILRAARGGDVAGARTRLLRIKGAA